MGRLASGQVMSLMFLIPGLWLLCNNVSTPKVSILFYYSLLKLVVLFNVDLEMPSTAVSLSLLLFWLLLLGYVLNRNSYLVKSVCFSWTILHQHHQVVLNYIASKEVVDPLAAKAGDLNLQTQMGSTKVSGETPGLLVGFMFGSISTLW